MSVSLKFQLMGEKAKELALDEKDGGAVNRYKKTINSILAAFDIPSPDEIKPIWKSGIIFCTWTEPRSSPRGTLVSDNFHRHKDDERLMKKLSIRYMQITEKISGFHSRRPFPFVYTRNNVKREPEEPSLSNFTSRVSGHDRSPQTSKYRRRSASPGPRDQSRNRPMYPERSSRPRPRSPDVSYSDRTIDSATASSSRVKSGKYSGYSNGASSSYSLSGGLTSKNHCRAEEKRPVAPVETSKPSGTDVAPVPTLEQLDAANETLKFLSQSMDIQALLRESSLTKIQGQGQDVVVKREYSPPRSLQPLPSTSGKGSHVTPSSVSSSRPHDFAATTSTRVATQSSGTQMQSHTAVQGSKSESRSPVVNRPPPSGPRYMRERGAHSTSAGSSDTVAPPPASQPASNPPAVAIATTTTQAKSSPTPQTSQKPSLPSQKSAFSSAEQELSSSSVQSSGIRAADKVTTVKGDLQDIRSKMTALKAVESVLVKKIREMSPGEIIEERTTSRSDGRGRTGGGPSLEERIKHLEEEVENLKYRYGREFDRRRAAELAQEAEAKKRMQIESILEDTKRESKAPLVVPAMMEAFQLISQLSMEALTSIGKGVSGSSAASVSSVSRNDDQDVVMLDWKSGVDSERGRVGSRFDIDKSRTKTRFF